MIKIISAMCAFVQFALAVKIENDEPNTTTTIEDLTPPGSFIEVDNTTDGCSTEKPEKAHCCTFFAEQDFQGESENLCIVFDSDSGQKAFDLRSIERINEGWNFNGSVRCSPKASVTICPSSDYIITETNSKDKTNEDDVVEHITCSS